MSLYRIVTKDSLELVGLLYEPETRTGKVLINIHGCNKHEQQLVDTINQWIQKT